MIGQEHVTGPLMAALRSNRVNHAYLFSGPRGCGKTTSARILARILNCAQNTEANPTDTPCGVCPSCLELATGGPGSLDVVEIDAASHGGVDDARDLRERATFSPTRDRFKIFILDEAHMVTAQGFNALLKIVEEPPPYLKFIFATTEPDKVIGTIRSRTHHYPFKLVAPDTMNTYLERLCQAEGIAAGQGVLPLVVRAGGGSVRDTLSVLDQLIAGAPGGQLQYDSAVALLGFTPATLLDDVVESLGSRDGAALFSVIERVINTGHEPRRFVEDLLERLRDLLVISLSGDGARSIFATVPEDQFARMGAQAGSLGTAELSRSADVVNSALSEMSGATSPRLHLELLCARLLLPAADASAAGLGARIDGIERALAHGGAGAGGAGAGAGGAEVGAGGGAAQASAPVAGSADSVPATPVAASDGTRTVSMRPESTRRRPTEPQQVASTPAAAAPQQVSSQPVVPQQVAPTGIFAQSMPAPQPAVDAAAPAVAEPIAAEAPAAAPAPDPVAAPSISALEPVAAPDLVEEQVEEPNTQTTPAALAGSVGSAVELEVFRTRWPEVLDALAGRSRAVWALVNQYAKVERLDGEALYVSLPNEQLLRTLGSRGGDEQISGAVKDVLGFDVAVVIDLEGSPRFPKAGSGSAPAAVASTPVAVSPVAPSPAAVSSGTANPVATVAPAENPIVDPVSGPFEPEPEPEYYGLEPEPESESMPEAELEPSPEPEQAQPAQSQSLQPQSLQPEAVQPQPEERKPFDASATLGVFGAAIGALANARKAESLDLPRVAGVANEVAAGLATQNPSATQRTVDQHPAGNSWSSATPDSGTAPAGAFDPAAGTSTPASTIVQGVTAGGVSSTGASNTATPPVAASPATTQHVSTSHTTASHTATWDTGIPDAPEPSWDAAPENVTGESSISDTPRQAAERRAQEQAQREAERRKIIDDPQPDDEDLESTGLVGVPLVMSMLGGVIIDELTDEP